jgi:hypothetical protein
VWCNKHQKIQTAEKSYCRKHVDGLAEEDDTDQIKVNMTLCNVGVSHIEYLNPKDRKEEKYTYIWSFFDNYSEEEELNVSNMHLYF